MARVAQRGPAPRVSRAQAILGDVQFWIPVAVLALGLALLGAMR